jgi:hypothetical protein
MCLASAISKLSQMNRAACWAELGAMPVSDPSQLLRQRQNQVDSLVGPGHWLYFCLARARVEAWHTAALASRSERTSEPAREGRGRSGVPHRVAITEHLRCAGRWPSPLTLSL